jgi:Hint domain
MKGGKNIVASYKADCGQMFFNLPKIRQLTSEIAPADNAAEEKVNMKRLDDVGTRRQLFRAIAAGAASAPFVALGGKSADALGINPGKRGGNGGAGCCCLLRGTKVLTPAGEHPVADLRIGDEVLTLSGPKAIKWIGYRKFTKDEDGPWQDGVMPIRVARLAIDDQAPHSDLYLSPQHCVFINDVLIPVKYLVNGTSIAPAAPSGMAAIEYYHIEFDTHEVVYAEGALVESFMEEGSEREYFSNFSMSGSTGVSVSPG